MIAFGFNTRSTRRMRQCGSSRRREDLDSDEMLLFALVRAIEILGEALGKVSEETRANTDLPWSSVIGMRNRLAHAYFDISHDILWTTVSKAVPELAEQLRAVLAKC